MKAGTVGQIGSAGETQENAFRVLFLCFPGVAAFFQHSPGWQCKNLIHSSILYLSVCYLYSYIRALPRVARGSRVRVENEHFFRSCKCEEGIPASKVVPRLRVHFGAEHPAKVCLKTVPISALVPLQRV